MNYLLLFADRLYKFAFFGEHASCISHIVEFSPGLLLAGKLL